MDLPVDLRMAIEKQSQGLKYAQLKEDAQTLSKKYRTESGAGKRLLTRENEAVSYSIARMPATYGAVVSALEFTLDSSDCRPRSLLDVGAGTGAAAWAANSLLNLDSIVCLEREEAMRSIGKKIMSDASEPLKSAKWLHNDITMNTITQKADLVVASYVLNELSEDNRLKAVEKLWNAANMMILLVEPGTPVGYSNLMKARQLLLNSGGHIAAPCPHQFECQLKENDWCHFKCRVPRSRLHRQLKDGDAPYEDEKFSYLAITREKSRQADARILRHPIKEKGRVTLDICSPEGIKRIEVSKKEGLLFKLARKAKCGDELPKIDNYEDIENENE